MEVMFEFRQNMNRNVNSELECRYFENALRFCIPQWSWGLFTADINPVVGQDVLRALF